MEREVELEKAADRARAAARRMAAAPRAAKDEALVRIAERLLDGRAAIEEANEKDVVAAREQELSPAMIDRLGLRGARLDKLAEAVRFIAGLDDPVGEVVGMRRRPNGLLVGQQRIPLGVIAMIYESRPNVTVDAAALCMKSGNAVMLRGGKEARHSNRVLADIVRAGLADAGLPEDAVQFVPPLSRAQTETLLGLSGKIDLLIPRGGEGLIRFVTEHARVPVVQHYKGVCHLYVDEEADLEVAYRLLENGKLSRPGVCNALEGLIVHEAQAEAFFSKLAPLVEAGLEVRGDERTVSALAGSKPASDEDYAEEFLAPVISARVVTSFDEALDHIARYGSLHTEVICTTHYDRAQRFVREVDASCVLVNASSRFNDGGMLGLGAEIGISTTKLHAYGPMGLTSLTSLKWVVHGEGQTR